MYFSKKNESNVSYPRLPIFFAPLVTILYYVSCKLSFIISLNAAVGSIDVQNTVVAFWKEDINWGNHYIYRACSEFFPITLAIFIASGVARGHEKVAALVAGCTISVCYLPGISYLWYIMLSNVIAHLGSPVPAATHLAA
jgi:hypothetical protein